MRKDSGGRNSCRAAWRRVASGGASRSQVSLRDGLGEVFIVATTLYDKPASMYVVTVLFEIDPLRRKEFRELILANAAASLQEPGCHRFDVCFSGDGLRCFLYELYSDVAAFQAHVVTSHFKEFETRGKTFVNFKKVDTFLLEDSSARNR